MRDVEAGCADEHVERSMSSVDELDTSRSDPFDGRCLERGLMDC